jgi:hypothetical protein
MRAQIMKAATSNIFEVGFSKTPTGSILRSGKG